MEKNVQQFQIRGMQRDLSVSKFNPEFAFENMNIRITAQEGNNLLSVTNEKGNRKIQIIENEEDDLLIEGLYLGYGILNDTLILFTTGVLEDPETSKDVKADRIYKLTYSRSGNLFRGELVFQGDLNFNELNPIETLCIFENEDIQKVYWVDGINQPRVINISDKFDFSKYVNTSFDFAQDLDLREDINISKNSISRGIFPAGTIQYAFSYFNQYAQESAIFYVSPLYYTSFKDRGGSAEDKASNSFNINIRHADPNFDYLRVYSIQRTSIDTTPSVKRVVDLPIFQKGIIKVFDETVLPGSEYSIPIGNPENLYIVYEDGREVLLDVAFPPKKSGLQNNTILYTYNVPESDTFILVDKSVDPVIGLRSKGSGLHITKIITVDNVVTTNISRSQPIYSYRYVVDTTASTINYIDNGTSGDVVDPNELVFKGSDNIIAQTMEHKDNTLFLGNIILNQKLISEEIVKSLGSWNVKFTQSKDAFKLPEPKGYYPYDNNLKYSSDQIKTFKYLDWYRFGIQFQHKSGKWSEAIYLGDLQNNIPITSIFSENGEITNEVKHSQAEYTISDLNTSRLIQLGFIKARGIVCYPDISDREVVAQGVLSPTLFNTQDRHTNSPFAQSSWFIRPNAPFDYDSTSFSDIDNPSIPASLNSRKGMFTYSAQYIGVGLDKYHVDSVLQGSLSESRHNYPLPPNQYRNCEIQSNYDNKGELYHPFTDKTSSGDIANYVGEHSDRFFVDQSIFTFHSPELEFDDSLKTMDSENLKLRIIGMVPITSSVADIDITTSTPVGRANAVGFYKEQIGNTNISRLGARGLNSGVFWMDGAIYRNDDGTIKTGEQSYNENVGYLIYPWHRNGSLNNENSPKGSWVNTAKLDKKKMSNIKYSYGSHYFKNDNIWNAYESDNSINTGISGIEIFDSNEIILTKLKAPENSNLDSINYYGNIDKVITSKRYEIIYNRDEGGIEADEANNSKLFRGNLQNISPAKIMVTSDPIRMKYKSTSHAVMALNYTEDGKQRILPTIKDKGFPINVISSYSQNNLKPFWDKEFKGIHQDVINSPQGGQYLDSIGYGYLWLAEIYNDNIINRFGGTSQEAIESNQWVPCGQPVSLIDEEGNYKTNGVKILYTEGDTFYGRYDCLKTYPFTEEDQNSIVDIVSFMVESRVNLDGRYDRNRGQIDNLNMSPRNFNLMNKVYSQTNNFFNYRSLNTDRFQLDDFKNSIVWSQSKTPGALTDAWTNFNLVSTLDLDGDKGPVNSLNRINNEIVAFQDRGISRILFNSRVQVNTSDGIPIEIANSYKVDGKVYINEKLGSTNKWSIKSTKSGLYFIDNLNKGIFRFDGEQFTNVTDELGFNSYFKDYTTLKPWNTVYFDNFISFYDNINSDLYFVNKQHALGFSEKIGQFTSFYDYGNVPLMFNISDKTFSLKDNKIWEQFGGDYNSFYGDTKPFYISVIANQEPHLEKIFTNIEFRADTWNDKTLLDETTFDRVDIWNEYQHGTQRLHMVKNRQSPLQKKYRIWRANLPRDNKFKRDRIRNPWVNLKLSMENPENYKTELHDLLVYYYK